MRGIKMRTEIKPKDLRNITGLKDWEKETNILFNADTEQGGSKHH